jgi:glycosyltransferase 2 family protein
MSELTSGESIVPSKKDRLFTFLRIFISIVLLGFIVLKNYKNFGEIFNIFTGLNYIFLVLAILTHFISLYADSLQWDVLLRALGIKINIGYLTQITIIGFLYNNLLPSNVGGDVYRIYDISKNMDVPASKSFSSILIQRFFGLISIVVYFAITSFSLYQILKHSIILITVFLAIAFLLFFVVIRPKFFRIDRLFRKFEKMKNIEKGFNSFNDTIETYKNKWLHLILGLVLNFISQSVVVIMFYFVSLTLGLKLNFMVFVFIVPVIFVFMGIPISIGGLGIRENTIVFLLTKFNVSNDQAVVFSLLILFIYIFTAAVGGLMYLIKNIFYKSKGFI